jgi:hypothetical protein
MAKFCARTAVARKWSSAGPPPAPLPPRRARDHTTQGGAYALRPLSFGTIRIDGSTCERDIVIDRGEVRKRKKGSSKQFSDAFGHTPLSIEEEIPWKCRQLVIGTWAYGRLPVMKEVESEAKRRRVELVMLPTS